MPVNESGDEVQQDATRDHTIQDEQDVLSWWKNHSGSFLLAPPLMSLVMVSVQSSGLDYNSFDCCQVCLERRFMLPLRQISYYFEILRAGS